jgi:hypothetical protein
MIHDGPKKDGGSGTCRGVIHVITSNPGARTGFETNYVCATCQGTWTAAQFGLFRMEQTAHVIRTIGGEKAEEISSKLEELLKLLREAVQVPEASLPGDMKDRAYH